ncbi:hypothetical protein AVEN_174484-1 [Araneus ventricosus]|uniref:Uncharacterized protein n=1 Tax=Araneus ventricosus TaxID=182803 RepID=A0A4Y2MES0_ARAVE|nr:hypothetical protein AVEN_174484-1 [Araneus ventricosus]
MSWWREGLDSGRKVGWDSQIGWGVGGERKLLVGKNWWLVVHPPSYVRELPFSIYLLRYLRQRYKPSSVRGLKNNTIIVTSGEARTSLTLRQFLIRIFEVPLSMWAL